MARPKKDASSAAPEGASIPVQEFLRTRDSVVTGLTTLQGSITQLMHAYVNHCNTIVGGGTSNSLDISNFLSNVPSSSEPLAIPAAIATTAAGETKQRRKRVKKEKDPNAPKRPLTAYFLYSHHARDIIKQDLKNANDGTEPKSQEIQDEATKRWNNMTPDEKKGWTDTYNTNYEKYKLEVADYQEKLKLEALEAGATEADAQAAAVEHDDTDESEIVAPKQPTPPATKAAPASKAAGAAAKKPRKNTKAAAAAAANGVAASPAPAATKAVVTPVPLPSETKPEPKSKGTKRKKEAPVKEAPAKAAPVEEEQPKKKKARKSKAAEETPVAAPEPEKGGEKKKRKRKSEAGNA